MCIGIKKNELQYVNYLNGRWNKNRTHLKNIAW